METYQAGYEEIEHTADWELHVWAPDLDSLLETAAAGMYALSGTAVRNAPGDMFAFKVQFEDQEILLVDFLSELLFLAEDQGMAFDQFQFSFERGIVHIQARSLPLLSQDKEIKAVTYHGLRIYESERGLEASIVFDV